MSIRSRITAAAIALTGAVQAAAPAPPPASPYRDPPAASSDGAGAPAKGVKPWRKTKYRPRITPLPVNITRWVQRDVESALLKASNGDMTMVGQLHRALGRDGTIQGVSGVRTAGLVRLPKKYRGTDKAIARLSGRENEIPVFDIIFPPSELARFAWDAIDCGFALAQFVQGPEDKYPVFTRLDPEFLQYRWAEDRWYYRTLEGLLPITPGDGRWIFHTPHGRYEPWNFGLWRANSRSFISKEHAILYRENFGSKLANPARVAVMPQGANEAQKQSWFAKVMAWGVNTVFGAPPGYDVKLVEIAGRGYEVYEAIIDTADRDAIINIAGQTVTTDGGAGFSNTNIHDAIRTDIKESDNLALCATLNTQAIPPVVYDLCGESEALCIEYDVDEPADVKEDAESLEACADAIERLDTVLTARGKKLDVGGLCARYGVPLITASDEGGVETEPDGDVIDDAPKVRVADAEVPDLDLEAPSLDQEMA